MKRGRFGPEMQGNKVTRFIIQGRLSMRLRPNSAFSPVAAGRRSGYTLVEILVATTLTLILMTAVVAVFGGVGDGIAKSRRAMEQFDRLRTAAQQLRLDLQGVTVTLDGRRTRPEENQGYFEYIEGGILTVPQLINSSGNLVTSGTPQAFSYDTGEGTNDLSVGQRGDVLMFTTRNAARPFLGRFQYPLSVDSSNPTLQSDVAEVAWFLRGKTLHRRVLLVAPGTASAINQYYQLAQQQGQQKTFYFNFCTNFYANNDISVHLGQTSVRISGQSQIVPIPIPNSLGDLTKRENRFAHPADQFPFDVRRWGLLGLPTLAECSSPSWMNTSWQNQIPNWKMGSTPLPPVPGHPYPNSNSLQFPIAPYLAQYQYIDMWDNSTNSNVKNVTQILPDQYLNSATTPLDGTRLADDVILTNVIGFDLKVWEPGAPVRSFLDSNTSLPVVVKPGDYRYHEALLPNVNHEQIVSYGAYVDLGWEVFDPNYPNPNNGSFPKDPPYPPASVPPVAPFTRFWYYGNTTSMLDAQIPGNPVGNLSSPIYPFGNPSSPKYPTFPQRVYDSGCFSYENEGIYCYFFDSSTDNLTVKSLNPNASQYQKPYYPSALNQWPAGTATNGLDDDHNGVVDDMSEWITTSPYLVPLRGIQVKVRCYEPDSRQIREVTIENDFLPK
jgi:type II secretory pathway component PulJ